MVTYIKVEKLEDRLERYTVERLKELAKLHNVTITSKMKKAELISAIRENENWLEWIRKSIRQTVAKRHYKNDWSNKVFDFDNVRIGRDYTAKINNTDGYIQIWNAVRYGLLFECYATLETDYTIEETFNANFFNNLELSQVKYFKENEVL